MNRTHDQVPVARRPQRLRHLRRVRREPRVDVRPDLVEQRVAAGEVVRRGALRGRPVAGTIFALVVEDAEAEEARLREAGAEIVKGCTDEPWGQRHFYVAVPGGLLLELVQMIAPDPAWPAANGL